jgi:uncharacterized phage protein gp47/JayE
MNLDPNIPKLVLDPANEGDLISMTYDRIRVASGNTITDFRPGSAAAAFVEGQTFALMELLYYLNLMPEAIAVEVFRLYGVRRSLGTQASGRLTFRLTSVAVEPFVLPAGYSVPYLDSTITILDTLTVQPGAQDGSVSARVDAVGSGYNAEPFDILVTNTGLGRVQTISNPQAFTGGSDLESLEDLVKRCQASTVARESLITALDYEIAAQATLGSGGRAVVVPNLSSDGFSFKQASVGIFLLDSTGRPASLTTCQLVADSLKPRILLGTALFCFPAVLVPMDIEVNLNVSTVSERIAQGVIESIESYLRPNSYTGGQVVLSSEVSYRARLVPGVRSVDKTLINSDALDYLLEQPWHYPAAYQITVNQIEPSGAILTSRVVLGDEDFAGDLE